MGAGELLGARLGARMVIAKGTRFIRPVFIAMVLALTLKLVYDAYLKSPQAGPVSLLSNPASCSDGRPHHGFPGWVTKR